MSFFARYFSSRRRRPTALSLSSRRFRAARGSFKLIRSVSWEPPRTAADWSPGSPHGGAANPAGVCQQRFTLSRGQQLPGLVDVTVHLGDQVLDGVEAF